MLLELGQNGDPDAFEITCRAKICFQPLKNFTS